MPDAPDRRSRTVLGYTITSPPRKRRATVLAPMLTIIGLVVVAIHEVVYRQTGGTDFDLVGVVSHAGADMLIVTFILAIVAGLHERRRDSR